MQCSLYSPNDTLGQPLETFSPLKKSRHETYRLTLVERFCKPGDAKSVTALSSQRPKGAFIAFMPDIY